MTIDVLNKANALSKKIKECNEALNCFECTIQYDEDIDPVVFDRTPRLIIDADDLDNGREQIALPFNLSNALIDFMKSEITKNKNQATKELKAL